MNTGIKYLIIPDVHGRDFWIRPVEETLSSPAAEIVFLGDFLDPYPKEWVSDDITWGEANLICRTQTLERFKRILEIKKLNEKRVTLLLGNHDCAYAIGDDICCDRIDGGERRVIIENLFLDNREEFLLAKECDIAGRHIIFSHAGILKGWADLVWGQDVVSGQTFNVVDRLNNAWITKDNDILDKLGYYDNYRGYFGYSHGSPVWSDLRSWTGVTPEETFGFNICGHTQVRRPVVLDQICGLDCRKAFYLDGEGILRHYDSGEEVVNSEDI